MAVLTTGTGTDLGKWSLTTAMPFVVVILVRTAYTEIL
jgi:hypothetical protein